MGTRRIFAAVLTLGLIAVACSGTSSDVKEYGGIDCEV